MAGTAATDAERRLMFHRCEYILDDYDRIFENRDYCQRLAWHYYAPWRQWFCGYHRDYLSSLYSVRETGWQRLPDKPDKKYYLLIEKDSSVSDSTAPEGGCYGRIHRTHK